MTDTKSDKTLIQFADKVTEISCQLNIDSIPIPQLIVVGAQSSGKSSLINKLVGYDLLPIGESMVTRTPIHIRLHHSADSEPSAATLSILDNGTLKTVYRMAMDDKSCKMDGMQTHIATITDKITPNKFSISKTPIFIDINSPRVTNISFVDLPGLVTIACTDKGQSETIVNDIKDLRTNNESANWIFWCFVVANWVLTNKTLENITAFLPVLATHVFETFVFEPSAYFC
jgi:GTPase SAR1 family protein